MENQMSSSKKIDDAFKIIKNATGITDVGEVVQKFMTRETYYSQLLKTVSESDQRIDKLKKENEMLSTRLQQLQIDSSEGDNPGVAAEDSDIVEMQQELSSVKKDYEILGDRFKRVNIVNDQVSNWAKRVYSKFGNFTDD
jgi:predicted RNase H-like nuclease (RuvC/YqgF family)